MSKKGPQTDVFLELHVPDFDLALDFYSYLGFQEVWRERGDNGYMVLKNGESILNFYGGSEQVYQHSYFGVFPKTTKRGYAVEIILLSDDIDALYKCVQEKIPDSIVAHLKLKPWGRKDFRIVDPFGYYIRIGERYNWIDKYTKVNKG